MNEQLIKELEDLIDKKVDNQDVKVELSNLSKMLKTGFENKTVGMEKVPKIFATNDNDKITKFYDTFGNQINALKLSGNFDLFNQYLEIHFGIKITYASDDAPSMQYKTKGKKFQKFSDLYTRYYLEDVPRNPVDAAKKILNSLDALTKENINITTEVKEELKHIIEKQVQHAPMTVKTVEKILTNARFKDMTVEDVAADVDAKLTLQQEAVNMVMPTE